MKRLEGEDELAPIINLKVPAYLKIVAQRQGRILVQRAGAKGSLYGDLDRQKFMSGRFGTPC